LLVFTIFFDVTLFYNRFAKKISEMQPKDLVQLAEQFGNPLYVYDAEKIQSQYHRLRAAFSKVERLRINYAVKALSNLAILQLLRQMGSNLDTVSIQEVQLGLHAGFQPQQIISF
jgi:diaminopimelate decarboxylase